MRYLFLLTALFMVSCDSKSSSNNIRRDRDNENQQFPITVYVYTTEQEMHRKFDQKETPSSLSELEGFANWYINPKTDEMTRCEIHVVRPRGASDVAQFNTWGHELGHCVYGSFHD